MSTRRGVQLVGALVIVLSACAREASPPPSSLSPLVPPDELPVVSAAPESTAVPSSSPDAPAITALPDGDCAFADLVPSADGTLGEITFVSGDRLYAASPDGASVRCLGELQRDQRGTVSWSPRGDRALLAGGTVLDAAGARRSGFDVGSPRVRWELPDGTGLVSPSSSGNSVARRDAADAGTRTDVAFLDRTWVVAPHPGGWGVLVAAGVADDGARGVFVSPAFGQGTRPILLFTDDDERVTELAVDAAGDVTYLVTDNGEQFRVHQLVAPMLSLQQLAVEQAPVAGLTVGSAWRTVAWKVGLCNDLTDTVVRDDRTGSSLVVGAGTPLDGLSVAPVGWLDSARLVVEARTLGCDGPADVWIWNLLDGSATLLVKTVQFAATRTMVEPSQPLAIDAQAFPPSP